MFFRYNFMLSIYKKSLPVTGEHLFMIFFRIKFENIEKMFPWYYIHSVSRSERVTYFMRNYLKLTNYTQNV